MKMRKTEVQNEGSTAIFETAIEIGDKGLALDLLMNGMYSKPVLAVCREVVSNCRDAHREAGIADRPVKVILPSTLDSTIHFIDYGPGISPSRIDTVFTKVGRSTKRDSNEETGGFGLGAKSPFAYTSQFSVTTVSEISDENDINILNMINENVNLNDVRGKNIKCEWTISKSSGSAKLHFAEITDEPTGTCVSVAVKKEDKGAFATAIVESVRFWDPKPEIVGDITFPKNTTSVSGNGWFISELAEFNDYSKQLAIVDGIPYPIHLKNVNKRDCNWKYEHEDLVGFSNQHFNLIFNTGDVDLSPNREELVYTKKTIAAIVMRLHKLKDDFVKISVKNISDSENYKQAIERKGIAKNARFIESNDWPDISWNGSKVVDRLAINPKVFTAYDYSWVRDRNWDTVFRRSATNFINYGSKIILNDSGNFVKRDWVTEASKHYDDGFVLITSSDNDTSAQEVFEKICEKNGVKSDVFETIPLSKYKVEKPAGERKERRARGTVNALLHEVDKAAWVESEINKDDNSVVFIVRNRENLFTDTTCTDIIPESTLKAIMRKLGVSKVYSITPSVAKKCADAKWRSLKGMILAKSTELSKKYSKPHIRELRIASLSNRSFNSNDLHMIMKECGVKFSDSDQRVIDESKKKHQEYIEIENLNSMFPFFKINDDGMRIDSKDLLKISVDMSQYPLLECLSIWEVRKNVPAVKEYINLINNK